MSIFHTCCAAGHRPHKLPFLLDEDHPQYRFLEQRLTKEILEKILMHDCDTFLTGMAQGVDMLCAELVLKLRKRSSGVRQNKNGIKISLRKPIIKFF